MVKGVNQRGLTDWIMQRVTAVLLLGYFSFLLYFLFSQNISSYSVWRDLFASPWMRWATLFSMLAVCWHAWIGLWTIFTDYVKCTLIRRVLEAGVCVLMLGYIVWTVFILWW